MTLRVGSAASAGFAEVCVKRGRHHATIDFEIYDALEDSERVRDDTLLYARRDVG